MSEPVIPSQAFGAGGARSPAEAASSTVNRLCGPPAAGETDSAGGAGGDGHSGGLPTPLIGWIPFGSALIESTEPCATTVLAGILGTLAGGWLGDRWQKRSGKGDLLPVSALPVDGTFPTDTAKFEKRSIAFEIPALAAISATDSPMARRRPRTWAAIATSSAGTGGVSVGTSRSIGAGSPVSR